MRFTLMLRQKAEELLISCARAVAAQLEPGLLEIRETAVKLEARAVQAEAEVEELKAVVAMTLERAALHKTMVAIILKAVPEFLKLSEEGLRTGHSWAKDNRSLVMVGTLIVVADWARELTAFTERLQALIEKRGITRAVDFQKLQEELGGFGPAIQTAVERAQNKRREVVRREAALLNPKLEGEVN